MKANDFKETIDTYKACVDILKSAGDTIIDYFDEAKDDDLIKDFEMNLWFNDDGCGLVIKPARKEKEDNPFNFPLGLSLYPLYSRGTLRVTFFFGPIKKEKTFDLNDQCSLKIITMFAVTLQTLEEKLFNK